MGYFVKLNYKKAKDNYKPHDELRVHLVYRFKAEVYNYSTGISVKKKDWNENHSKSSKTNKQFILKSDLDSADKNLLLEQKIKELNDVILNLKKQGLPPTVDLIKSHLNSLQQTKIRESYKEIHLSLLLEKYLTYIRSDAYLAFSGNSQSYVRSLTSSLKDIIAFTNNYQMKNGIRLLPADIDDSYMGGLIQHCIERGLQRSTIKKRIKVLVSFGKWLEQEHGVRFIVPKVKHKSQSPKKQIIWFEEKELQQLFEFREFEITNKNHTKHLTKNGHKIEYLYDKMRANRGSKTITYTSYEVHKDMLVFLCGTGLRFSDLVELKSDNFRFIGNNNFKRAGYQLSEIAIYPKKTSESVNIPVSRMVFEIYKKYIKNRGVGMYLFPRTGKGNPISGQKFNKHIKEICRIVGLNRLVSNPDFDWYNNIMAGTGNPKHLWEVVSSHIGRRTMIRNLVDCGYDRRTIMSITGHKQYKTLDVYYEVTQKDRMKHNHKLFSYVLDSPEKEKATSALDQFQKHQVEVYQSLLQQGKLNPETFSTLMEELYNYSQS